MYKVISCLAVIWTAGVLSGQSKAPGQYQVHIRMRESNPGSKPKESTYALLLQAGVKGTLNASYRIPYYLTKGDAKELHTIALGSIFDCVAHDAEGGVRLDCGFESSFPSGRRQASASTAFPAMIQSRQAHTSAVVPLGAEVPMAELDDPTTGGRLEFFISAERFSAPSP